MQFVEFRSKLPESSSAEQLPVSLCMRLNFALLVVYYTVTEMQCSTTESDKVSTDRWLHRRDTTSVRYNSGKLVTRV